VGSTSLTTDAAGALVARVLYYPYGETRYITGTLTTDYGYTGQRRDSYIDMLEMGARWYDPRLARWASADIIVPNSANAQSLNRFTYVRNNPLKYVDVTGHNEVPSGIPPWEDHDNRTGSLPPGYVIITVDYTLPDGTVFREYGAGVIIDANAILSHDHWLQPGAVVISVDILDPETGASILPAPILAGDYLFDGGDETSLFVFQDDIFPAGDVATLGDADDLETGIAGEQVVFEGARARGVPAGLYSTTIVENNEVLKVSPDYTIPGDSGNPLYVGNVSQQLR